MDIHNWKNKELNRLLMEKFGLGKEKDAGSDFLKSKGHDPETGAPFKGTKTKRGAAKHQRRKEKLAGKEIEELEERGEKPDFLDLDKDGDKKEPMKSAAEESEEEEDEDLDEGRGHPGAPIEGKDHPGECAAAHPNISHEKWTSGQNIEEATETDEELEERKKRDDPRNYVGRPGHVRNPSN